MKPRLAKPEMIRLQISLECVRWEISGYILGESNLNPALHCLCFSLTFMGFGANVTKWNWIIPPTESQEEKIVLIILDKT